MGNKSCIVLYTFIILLMSCSSDEISTSPLESNRNYKMGFTTWSFGPTQENVNTTYSFIANNADIYTEQIDNKIPWGAWINDTSLPAEFTNEIARRLENKIENQPLLLAVSLLNTDRNDLAEDFNGIIPSYTNLNDTAITDAYFKHIAYLVDQFSPEYLVIAIEVNELRLRAENKWSSYILLIKNVTSRIKEVRPNLKISESISLHNLYEPETSNPTEYIDDIVSHMNQMDFASISFYPFLKNQHTKTEFQQTFNFLHSKVTRPIAFVETNHIAENLYLPNFNVNIDGNETEQNLYLETLLENAEEQDYEFIIWWAHRDYDALWETFPEEVKDIGKLWRDTGLLDEDGNERLSYNTWKSQLEK